MKKVYEFDSKSAGRRVIEANTSKVYQCETDRVAAPVAAQKIDRELQSFIEGGILNGVKKFHRLVGCSLVRQVSKNDVRKKR
jgi:hypothetical protein